MYWLPTHEMLRVRTQRMIVYLAVPSLWEQEVSEIRWVSTIWSWDQETGEDSLLHQTKDRKIIGTAVDSTLMLSCF